MKKKAFYSLALWKSILSCSSSLREEARRRDSSTVGHLESLTPTLSLRQRE
jgi:hypothetical protein